MAHELTSRGGTGATGPATVSIRLVDASIELRQLRCFVAVGCGDQVAEDGPTLLLQKAIDDHGRLDVLVNNVGAVRIRVDGFLATSDGEIEWALQMNFFTALRATRPHCVRCSSRVPDRW